MSDSDSLFAQGGTINYHAPSFCSLRWRKSNSRTWVGAFVSFQQALGIYFRIALRGAE